MKPKIVIFLLLLFTASVFYAKASETDTIWTKYDGMGAKISILGSDLYCNVKSKVKIESNELNKNQTVTFDHGNIEKISKYWYYITPNKIGNGTITIGKAFVSIVIKPLLKTDSSIPNPNPQVYFDGKKNDWTGVISKEELKNTNKLIISNPKFEIVYYAIKFESIDAASSSTIGFNGSTLNIGVKGNLLRYEEGRTFYIQDITVKNPDGTIRILPTQKYKVIDNYQNEFIRKTVLYKPYTYDLNLMKTDLRIKLTGKPTKEDIKTVSDLADELNSILETIKVKIVDRQPTITLIFDSIAESTEKYSNIIANGFKKTDCGYKLMRGSLFFPFLKKAVLYVNTSIDPKYRSGLLKKNIVELLGKFKNPGLEIGKDSSIFSYSNNLSSYDKYLLKTLYSYGGEYKVLTLIDKKFDYPDRNGVFILILILSVCLLFVFSEIYNYYGVNFFVEKIRSKIIRRIIEALLVSQIPVIAILILLIETFLEGDFHEIGFVLLTEIFFIPFAILTGLLFLGLDYLLNKMKRKWLVTILNFFLSFFCIWLAYQVIYLFYTPAIVPLEFVDWKLLIIPFLIILYRIYARFQTNKITSLLQEKELELAKQKELKFKSDLNALQARINPHFLYNALNSLASLAYIDATRTEKMALSLAKLFRYNINKEEEHFSSLKDEIEMTEIYLEIEKNRFEEKLEYSIDVQNSLYDFEVPKFLLQPLAENAVKHGISKIIEKGIIKIKIFEQGQKVIIEIYDNGPDFPGGLISGYGLQNTYEKLKLLYKKPFDIEFVNKPEKKLVIMLTK
jgi:two-component system, LytTR family, sensor kinase